MLAHTPALDGVRGIAILLVLLHHFTTFAPVTSADHALQFVAHLGWSGVDVFLVLSGFLITGILIDTRGSHNYLSSFYMRRVLRIVPLYYLVVFLSLVALPNFPALNARLAGPSAVEQWPYWTYLVNFAIADRGAFAHGVLDVAWSLAIEEQFYLLWPMIVWVTPPRWLGALCAAVVLGALVLRVLALGAATPPISVYVLPYFRADALALGGLVAWSLRRGWLSADGLRRSWSPATLAVTAIAAAVATALLSDSAWWWEPLIQRAGYSLLALSSAAVIVCALVGGADGRWSRTLSVGWLRAFGKYSYCLYLIHLPVSRLMQGYVASPTDLSTLLGSAGAGQFIYYALAGAPTFAVAWLSWRFFEAPVLSLKRYFPYR